MRKVYWTAKIVAVHFCTPFTVVCQRQHENADLLAKLAEAQRREELARKAVGDASRFARVVLKTGRTT
jgi:hypothetical protein